MVYEFWDIPGMYVLCYTIVKVFASKFGDGSLAQCVVTVLSLHCVVVN